LWITCRELTARSLDTVHAVEKREIRDLLGVLSYEWISFRVEEPKAANLDLQVDQFSTRAPYRQSPMAMKPAQVKG
jgi:hypothetical protein